MKRQLFGLLVLLFVANAPAQIFTYQFCGLTTSGGYGDFIGVPDGTPYTGIFSYSLSQPDLSARIDLGQYSFTSFSLQVGSQTITAAPAGERNFIEISNQGGPSHYSSDDLQVSAFSDISGTAGNFQTIAAFLVAFSDGSSLFSNDSLPATPLSRSNFQFANLSVLGFMPDGSNFNFGGSVDQLLIVPEPSALELFLCGAGWLWCYRKGNPKVWIKNRLRSHQANRA